jgi:hypothetical protein
MLLYLLLYIYKERSSKKPVSFYSESLLRQPSLADFPALSADTLIIFVGRKSGARGFRIKGGGIRDQRSGKKIAPPGGGTKETLTKSQMGV